jgi:DNA polymerase-4
LGKTEVSKRPVRLFGISLSQLDLADTERQLALFEQRMEAPKRKRLNRALDTISDKYGDEAIVPGTLLEE